MSRIGNKLTKLEACKEAILWVNSHRELKTLEELWEACERPDWLVWLAAKTNVDKHLIVKALCAYVRTLLKYIPEGEIRPRVALETAEQWARGEATIAEVRRAAYAAYIAADNYTTVVTTSNAIYACIAATFAAANDYFPDLSYTAHSVINYVNASINTSSSSSALKTTHRERCEIIRSIIPCPKLSE